MDEYLTIDDLARLLRVSHSTAYKMVRDAQIPAIKVGRQWRIARKTVEEFGNHGSLDVNSRSGNVVDPFRKPRNK